MTDFAGYQRMGDPRAPGDYRGALVLPQVPDGRVLLQLRDDIEGIVAPGRWGLFGGEIEAGESPVEAASRELEEETGLAFAPERFAPFAAVVSGAPPHGLLYVHRLAADFAPGDIRLGEGSGFALASPRQARRLDLLDHLAEVLDAFWQRWPAA